MSQLLTQLLHRIQSQPGEIRWLALGCIVLGILGLIFTYLSEQSPWGRRGGSALSSLCWTPICLVLFGYVRLL